MPRHKIDLMGFGGGVGIMAEVSARVVSILRNPISGGRIKVDFLQ